MSDEGRRAAGQVAQREVPVDWEALEDAFENNAPEVHSYLHVGTGEVLRVVDGIADPEMHRRIAADATYLRVESVSSREQYRWMERFIQMVDEPQLRALLTQAIDGKGAFRRFKDVLMSHAAERERWFTFRSERLRVFMEAWLMAADDRDGAADQLLESIRRDREWNEGAARLRLLQMLEAIGLEDPWAAAQRRRLSQILFG